MSDTSTTGRYIALESLFIRAEERYVERGAIVELPLFSGDILTARGAVVALPEKAKNGTLFDAHGLAFRYTTKGGWEAYAPELTEDAAPDANAPVEIAPEPTPEPPTPTEEA